MIGRPSQPEPLADLEAANKSGRLAVLLAPGECDSEPRRLESANASADRPRPAVRTLRHVTGWLPRSNVDRVPPRRAWLVLQFGDDRQYGGNAGYADRQEVYRYDRFVANHRRVAGGDLLVVRDHDGLIGAARVATVRSSQGTKVLRKCPTCATTGIKARTTRSPRFRCNKGHEFESPLEQIAPCTLFVAELGDSFSAAPAAVALDQLRAACPRYTDQLSIQEIDLEVLMPVLERVPALIPILGPIEGEAGLSGSEYRPRADDTRTVTQRQLRARQGRCRIRLASLFLLPVSHREDSPGSGSTRISTRFRRQGSFRHVFASLVQLSSFLGPVGGVSEEVR